MENLYKNFRLFFTRTPLSDKITDMIMDFEDTITSNDSAVITIQNFKQEYTTACAFTTKSKYYNEKFK